jgi:cobalt/nickel transport system permease protein
VHHVVVERWSRQKSWLHSRDARAKLVVALAFIVCVATTTATRYTAALSYLLVLIALSALARLPLPSLALRAAFVLPFSAAFAIASWLSNDSARATGLLWKSYLSAFSVLLLVSSTPLVQLFKALEWFRAPQLVILIAQFLYRYLFVISEQAQHMRLAARCRGGASRTSLAGAASALSVLFARSYARADGIQRAMLARGFSGRFPTLTAWRFGSIDTLFALVATGVCAAIRWTG